jgi:Cu(I)/Ag(I) efflux system membrane fusion protein
MRRVRERFGTSHDTQRPQLSQRLEVSADFHSQLVKLWEAYLSLQQALASDNLLLAQQAVTHFQISLSEVEAKPLAEDAHQIWKKEYSKFTQILQNMDQAENLKSIRKNFSLLSDELLVLVRSFGTNGFRTVYQMHCPMVFDGKGAMWLQDDKQVSNPYFGQVMLKCGDRIELISDGKMREHKGERHHAQHLDVSADFHLQLVKLWESYLSLQQALASDNLLPAQQAVTQFQTFLSEVDAKPLAEDAHQIWKKEYSKFTLILQNMDQAENLKSIRKIFSLLSDELLVLVRSFGTNGFRTVYQLHCPMVFNGKGAMWLQEDKQVSNPYFGQAMLKCGDRIELISDGKMKEHKGEHQHAQHLEVSAEFQSQLVKLWESYLSLQQALANDNFSLAQQANTHFQESISAIDAKTLAEDVHEAWKKEYSKFTQILQNMDQAEDLKSIRKIFSLLSDELLVLINTFGPDGFGTVYRLHCPMVFSGKGAMWLQEDKQVSNPYFGTVMLKCADRVELISSGKTEEHKGEHHHE